jgi:GxxExxY protein
MARDQSYPHSALTRDIIGAFYDVYNALGAGFRETVYERALQLALGDRGVRTERQRSLRIRFRGRPVGLFRADLVVEEAVVIELKALPTLERSHAAQLLNLLRATGLEVGLLLNFGPEPQIRRLVHSHGSRR